VAGRRSLGLHKAIRTLRSRRPAAELGVLSLVGLVPVHRVRVWALRRFGARISATAIVYGRFQVRAARHLRIGDRANIGEGSILDARGGLEIGADTNLSSQVHIWTAQHDWNSSDFGYVRGRVSIGARCWLGPRVTVLPGTTIGDGVVVAAGAVVRGELAPFGLYGGVPARRLADRTAELNYELPSRRDKTWWW
jgi:acetyltransferase-like isoleucine patch superfamily enzyme